MKITKAMIVLLTLIILSIGAVSATDSSNFSTDNSNQLSSNNLDLNNNTNEVSTLRISDEKQVSSANTNNAGEVSNLASSNTVSVLGESKTIDVNADNYGDYFTDDGTSSNVNVGDTINFNSNLEDKTILIDKNITLTSSSGVTLTNCLIMLGGPNLGLETDSAGTTINGLNMVGSVSPFDIYTTNITLINNKINLTDSVDNPENIFGIVALNGYGTNLKIINNTINVNGSKILYAIQLVKIDGAVITGNNITTNGTAKDTDASTYISQIFSIYMEKCNNANITGNNITTDYYAVDPAASFDTLVSVYGTGCANATFTYNNVTTNGNKYAYGIQFKTEMDSSTYEMSDGSNLNISYNNIKTTAKNYANGLNLMSTVSGLAEFNNITANAENLSYPIYSDNWQMGVLSFNYRNNTVIGNAFAVYGIDLAGRESNNITGNNVTVKGNYTMGIVLFDGCGSNNISNNTISTTGNGVGSVSVGDKVSAENTGIKIWTDGKNSFDGSNTIQYNNISTTGKYSVNCTSTSSNSITNNYLHASSFKGDKSVYYTGTNMVNTNTPVGTYLIYVSSTGDDSKDGLTSSTAKKTLINALSALDDDGTIIVLNDLTENSVNISKNVDIVTENSHSIDGGLSLIFNITNNVTVNLVNLTLFNGNGSEGGAISNNGTLTLTNCTLHDNNATSDGGAIYNTATLTINNCTFYNNNATDGYGGAIYNDNGTVTVNISTFYNNTGYYGGAIGTRGGNIYNPNCTVSISNSKFYNNNGTRMGGVIYNGYSFVNMTNSSFINNTANINSGVIYINQGAINAFKCSFIHNSAKAAGVSRITTSVNYDEHDGNEADFYNVVFNYCIFLNNTADSGASDIVLYNTNSIDANYNWWGTNTKVNSTRIDSGVNTTYWIIMSYSPTLRNMDPSTSKDITVDFNHYTDGTTNSTVTTGYGIPDGLNVDFKIDNGTITTSTATTVDGKLQTTYTSPATGTDLINISTSNMNLEIPIIVKTSSYNGIIYVSKTSGNDANDGSEYNPVNTLTYAISLATSSGGSGKIIILDGTYTEHDMDITSDLNITAKTGVVINANKEGRFFNITSGKVYLENLTFINSQISNMGAIKNLGDLTVYNCTFENNTATSTSSYGGVIYTNTGNLTVSNSKFNNNSAARGGALYQVDSNVTITNCTFTNNGNISKVSMNGGAIANYGKNTVKIYNSTFINNTATNVGGAIYNNANDNLIIKYSKFINNTVTNTYSGYGAAIGCVGTSSGDSIVNVSYSIFLNNTANITQSESDKNVTIYSNEHSTIIADYNWWGNNTKPLSLVSDTGVTIDKWIIMTVSTSDLTNVNPNTNITIDVDFNHYTDGTTNTSVTDEYGIPDGLTVDLTTSTGSLNTTSSETINDQVLINYNATAKGENTIIVNSASESKTITFTTSSSEPYTGIIYVSPNGYDTNSGSESSPVKTLAKAIELATSSGGSGKIVMKTGNYKEHDLEVTSELSITADGEVIIDANGLGRIFNVASGKDFNITGLTLINGKITTDNGGAINVKSAKVDTEETDEYEDPIYVDVPSTLNAVNCTFINNTAKQGGAISVSTSTTTLNNCKFTNNNASVFGGAVYVGYKSNLTIFNGTFDNNTANSGAGVYSATSLAKIINSTFINNNASSGGAVYTTGYASNGFNMNITGSIFINNNASSGGAIYHDGQKVNITFCVFDNNTSNTISSFNTDPISIEYNYWGNNTPNFTKLLTKIDNPTYWVLMNVVIDPNTIDIKADSNITLNFNNYTDGKTNYTFSDGEHIANGYTPKINTKLGEITNINPTSTGVSNATYKAVKSGTDELLFNNENLANITVNTPYTGPIYVNSNGNNSNPGTMEKPKKSFNDDIDGEGALTAAGVNGEIIVVGSITEHDIEIKNNLTIKGINNAVINGDKNQIFLISNPIANVIIDSLTLTNAYYTGEYGGGAIKSYGSLKLINCTLYNNNASNNGGAIYINGNNLIIINSSLYDNHAKKGGAILIQANYASSPYTLTISNSSLYNNSAENGGAIFSQNANININHSILIDNNASTSGGFIYVNGDNTLTSTIKYSVIYNNTAEKGKAIYSYRENIVANYDWWGTNNGATGLVDQDESNPATINTKYPVIMTINPNNGSNIYDIEITTITVNLNKYLNDNRGLNDLTETLPNRSVVFDSTSGTYTVNIADLINSAVSNKYVGSNNPATLSITIDNQTLTLNAINKPIVPPSPTKTNTSLNGNFKDNTLIFDLTANGTGLSGKNIIVIFTSANGTKTTYTLVTGSDGKVNFDLNDYTNGDYTVDYTYSGDSAYEASSGSLKITVNNTVKTNTSLNGNFKDNTLIFDLTANGTGLIGENITVTVISANGTKTVYTLSTGKDGKVSLDLSNYTTGNYTIDYTYSGNDKYEASSGSLNITESNHTKPIKTVLNGNVTVNIIYGQNYTYTVTLTDANVKPLSNKTVSITLSKNGLSKTYNISTDSQGIASLPITLYTGDYTIYSIFNGDNLNLASNNVTCNLKVNNVEDSLTINNLSEILGAGDNLTGKLLDINGNPIIGQHVALNLTNPVNGASKIYWVTTDTNGEYQLEINLSVGTYTATASYGNLSTNIGNIIVSNPGDNHTGTVLSADKFNHAYDAGQNFTGKLLDVTGNPIIGQHVALNLTNPVNGASKVYWVTTDSDGEYQLEINLASGEYTAHCSYSGTSIYSPSNAYNIITVN